jgi:hypothetical protein
LRFGGRYTSGTANMGSVPPGSTGSGLTAVVPPLVDAAVLDSAGLDEQVPCTQVLNGLGFEPSGDAAALALVGELAASAGTGWVVVPPVMSAHDLLLLIGRMSIRLYARRMPGLISDSPMSIQRTVCVPVLPLMPSRMDSADRLSFSACRMIAPDSL